MRITNHFRLLEAKNLKGNEWDVVLIEEGTSLNGVHYPLEVLRKGLNLFEGAKANAFKFVGELYDHLPGKVKNRLPQGVVENIVGWFKDPQIKSTGEGKKGIVARLHLSEKAGDLIQLLRDAWDDGQYKLLGLSIDAHGETIQTKIDGVRVKKCVALERVDSVDIVSHPAAGGRFDRLVASVTRSLNGEGTMDKLKKLIFQLVEAIDKTMVEGLKESELTEAKAKSLLQKVAEEFQGEAIEQKTFKATLKSLHEMIAGGKTDEAIGLIEDLLKGKALAKKIEKDGAAEAKATKEAAEAAEATRKKEQAEKEKKEKEKEYGEVEEARKKLEEANATLLKTKEAIDQQQKLVESQTYLHTTLTESKLPDPIKKKLRKRFESLAFEKEVLTEAIKDEEEVLDALTESVFPKVPKTEVGADDRTRFGLAFEGMLAGEDQKDKDDKPVPRFYSLKESYKVITGLDPNAQVMMFGIQWGFVPQFARESGSFYNNAESLAYKGFKAMRESIMRESLTTASWAEIMGDSITRRMQMEYTMSDLKQDVDKIVSTKTPVNDFRTQRALKMGGYTTLSTVAEGGTYQSLTSPTDTEETYALSKKGGLDDITMEMLDNDDVGALKLIPKRLGTAAATTLYRNIFDMFNGNADHNSTTIATDARNNSGDDTSADITLADAGLQTCFKLMTAQAPYGMSSNELGMNNAPALLMVPATLWHIAHKIVNDDNTYQTGTVTAVVEYPATTSNVWKGRIKDYIVLPYWDATSTAYWWAIADPKKQPTVEMGYYKGKEEPEMFIQDQMNVGSVFTADKITTKVRFIYGYALLDFRTVYYSKFVA